MRVYTRGFMRCLSQESSKLPLAGGIITGCAKATEGASGSNESVIAVESIARTPTIVSVLQHLVKERGANDVCNITTTTTRCWCWCVRCWCRS